VSLVALSPSSRKRRSELDKLLEAGSSSFHFETAKEATSRMNGENLGPIHVDVDSSSVGKTNNETEEESESEPEEVFEPAPKKVKRISLTEKPQQKIVRKPDRLLQQADSSSSSSSTSSSSSVIVVEKPSPPKKKGNPERPKKKLKTAVAGPTKRGRQAKFSRKRTADAAPKIPDEFDARRELLEKYLPLDLFDELELKLVEVDGSEADIESMQFSFERTPVRESWYVCGDNDLTLSCRDVVSGRLFQSVVIFVTALVKLVQYIKSLPLDSSMCECRLFQML